MPGDESGRRAVVALGRCIGARLFAVFGGCWLLLACSYGGRLHLPEVAAVVATVVLLVVAAGRLRSRAKVLTQDVGRTPADRVDDQIFGVINAVTWVGVFLLFVVLPRLHLDNYVFPAFVGLVGAHFLPMTGRYRHRANLVTGSTLLLWAVGCTVALRGDGVRLAVWVTAGAGVVLWASAGWALRTARRLLGEASLR